jgi:hypothetical protein
MISQVCNLKKTNKMGVYDFFKDDKKSNVLWLLKISFKMLKKPTIKEKHAFLDPCVELY